MLKRIASEIRQVMTAQLIDEALAGVLGVAPASAAMRLVRQYKNSAGRILEITDTCYPADRVSVSFQLKRATSQG